jgi:Cse1
VHKLLVISSNFALFILIVVQFVSNAIQFLASVAERPAYKQLFADPNTLTGICERVIVPNMEFRGMHVVMYQ